jgi:signal transduction histidine kinase
MHHKNGEFSREQEEALQEAYIHFLEAEKLEDLWQEFVEYIPRITGWTDCSIYLRKEFITNYSAKNLIESDGSNPGVEPRGDFIILGATNLVEKQALIGRAYYPSGEGLTGNTFFYGNSYIIPNINDAEELHNLYPELERSDRYGFLTETRGRATSMLLVPLISGTRKIGVLKLYTDEKDREYSRTVLTFVEGLVTTVVKAAVQKYTIQKQEEIILTLAGMSGQEKIDTVIDTLTKTLVSFLDCSFCQIYQSDENNENMILVSTNGKKPRIKDERKRGVGLIGWIFQTGRPLILDDMHAFDKPILMTPENLRKYSDGQTIDDEDMVCQDQPEKTEHIQRPIPFIGVPIRCCEQGEVLGVLCVHYLSERYLGTPKPFDRDDLNRLVIFANTLAIAFHNDLISRRNAFLIDLGKIWDRKELFEKIANEIPKLIKSSNCFIFIREDGPDDGLLQLKHSNKSLRPMEYKLGQGKTGFCGLVKKTVVFLHFGSGAAGQQRLRKREEHIFTYYRNDLLGHIYDEEHKQVGIVQVWDGHEILLEDGDELRIFKHLISFPVKKRGLISDFLQDYLDAQAGASYSFIAVPIIHSNKVMDGVITVGRPIPGVPYNGEDIQFVQNIASTVGALLDNYQLREQQEMLVQTLAHEVNTPLVSIRITNENLLSDIQEIARGGGEHFRQVQSDGAQLQRQFSDLQMLTETVLVLKGNVQPKFEKKSIYIPIKNAISLYSDWADEEGIKINPPEALGYTRYFPEIDLDIRTMDLVFKNLLHNAIKYSYKPTDRMQARFINIHGLWPESDRKRYQISIENYGVPITEEEKVYIFRPGYRGIYAKQRNRRGAGMGLSLVKFVVETIHNGKVFVESKKVEGGAHLTRFYVVLPIDHVAVQN